MMNIFNMFEQRVGQVFGEGNLENQLPLSFKKLAKQLSRKMKEETYTIDGESIAPALYTILVSPQDDALMKPIYKELCQECALFIKGKAEAMDQKFVGYPLVRFMVDPSMARTKFCVFAENVDAQTLKRLHIEEENYLNAESHATGEDHDEYHAPEQLDEKIMAETPEHLAHQPISHVPGIQNDPSLYRQPDPILDSRDMGLEVMPDLDLSESAPLQVPDALEADSWHQVQQEPDAGGYGEDLDLELGNMPVVNPVMGIIPPIPQDLGQQMLTDKDHVQPQPHPQSHQERPITPPTQRRIAPGRPRPEHAHQRMTTEPKRPRALLIDHESGKTYPIRSLSTIIGRERNPEHIILRDPNVSRRHARIFYHNSEWHIQDLNSTNGTLVNDCNVESCILQSGDLITLGLVNLEFREG